MRSLAQECCWISRNACAVSMVSLLRGQLPSARKIQTKHFSQLSPSLLYPQRYICRPWVMRTSTQLGFLFFSSSSSQVTKHEDSTRCINTGHQCIFLPLQKKKKIVKSAAFLFHTVLQPWLLPLSNTNGSGVWAVVFAGIFLAFQLGVSKAQTLHLSDQMVKDKG